MFDVPEDTRRAFAARSPSTGSLCLASEDQTALKRVRVRWIKPNGAVSIVDQFDLDAVVPNYNLSAVGMSADATNGEVCWVVLRRDNSCFRDGPTEIRGYREGSSVPFRTHTVTGRSTSSTGSGFEFRALSGDDLLLNMTRDCTTPVDERLRLTWTGSAFSERRFPLVEGTSFMFVD